MVEEYGPNDACRWYPWPSGSNVFKPEDGGSHRDRSGAAQLRPRTADRPAPPVANATTLAHLLPHRQAPPGRHAEHITTSWSNGPTRTANAATANSPRFCLQSLVGHSWAPSPPPRQAGAPLCPSAMRAVHAIFPGVLQRHASRVGKRQIGRPRPLRFAAYRLGEEIHD